MVFRIQQCRPAGDLDLKLPWSHDPSPPSTSLVYLLYSSGEWQQTLEAIQSAGPRKPDHTVADASASQPSSSRGKATVLQTSCLSYLPTREPLLNVTCRLYCSGLLAGAKSSCSTGRDPDADEYSDDDDPGYTRHDIRGQEAFIAQELDLSDDDASHRDPIEFHSPSKQLRDPDGTSFKDSGHLAEPAGTSTYGSEALSDQSHSTTHPGHSNTDPLQQLSITLRPESATVAGTDPDAGHLVPLDSQRSHESEESSVSLTITDRSRTDLEEHPTSTSATDNLDAATLTGTALVHQQSGFRYLLDGMLEKVSDAFGRHSPRSGAQGEEGSEHSADSLSEGGDMQADDHTAGMPTLRTHHR